MTLGDHESSYSGQNGSTTGARPKRQAVFAPPVDILEGKQNVRLVMEMPGVEQDGIDVTLEHGVLTVEGKITPISFDDSTLRYSEYEQGNYRRSFNLSDELNLEEIDASIKDGVLTITIPKSEKMQPKKIIVKTS